MHYFFRQHPLLKILFPLILGILTQRFYFDNQLNTGYTIILLLLIVFVFLSYQNKIHPIKAQNLGMICGFLLFFATGLQITYLNNHQLSREHYTHFPETDSFIAELNHTFSETNKTHKTTARISAVHSDSGWQHANGKIILYFLKDSLKPPPQAGTQLLILGKPDSIPPPLNPYSFDYQSYLKDQNIFGRALVQNDAWIEIGKTGFSLKLWAGKLRQKMLDILKNHGLDGDEYAVSAAILLGFDDDLDEETRAQFSGSGAMHILCVSGLHVGIIYLVSLWMLGFLKRLKAGRFARPVILLCIIWVYALITGLSPSVMRASLMISFIIFGDSMKRHRSVYNSLMASALVLIVFNPLIIFQLGFQLSYAAVIAIISLQKPIYNWFYCKNKIADKIWEICSVSIAAQIGTFPIAIFYFHQFPVYFLITNILIIPFSGFIIYAGILFLLTSWIPYVSVATTWLLTFMIKALNHITSIISNLPGASLEGISLSPMQYAVLAILVIFSSFAFLHKSRKAFVAALGLVLILGILEINEEYQVQNQDESILFSNRKSAVIEIVKGKNALLIADSTFFKDPKAYDYTVEAYNIKKRIRSIKKLDLNTVAQSEDFGVKSDPPFLQIGDQLILLQGRKALFKDSLQNPLPVDHLLITDYQYKGNKNTNFFEARKTLSLRQNFLKEPLSDVHFLDRDGALSLQ